jgi:hypothetical protein
MGAGKPNSASQPVRDQSVRACPDWFEFNPVNGLVQIFGVRYSLDLLRTLGVQSAGYTFKLLESDNGVVVISQERNAIEAAAPDMLIALQNLVALFEGTELKEVVQALDIIAKVTGVS